MAISPARLRSDSSIRVRCGDGPCRLRAIPSGDPFGPGSPLRFPLRFDLRFYPYRLRSLALAARSCTSYK